MTESIRSRDEKYSLQRDQGSAAPKRHNHETTSAPNLDCVRQKRLSIRRPSLAPWRPAQATT